jgi:L-threonylcarbamoyladenylate synthase
MPDSPGGLVTGSVPWAAARLAAGELVAFPTETVYGLGARADADAAVMRIYAAKGRPPDHPLIVHVADADAVAFFCDAPPQHAAALMAAFWPGPLTVIVPRRPGAARAAAAGQDSIGLRMPAQPIALALLREAARLGVPGVAAPSANRFGRVSPTRAAHVRGEFGDALVVLDGGECLIGIESAIVDCTRPIPALLRPGQLGRDRIESVLGVPLAAADAASPRVPGSLASHYAPAAPVRLVEGARLAALQAEAPLRPGETVGVYSRVAPPAAAGWRHRQMPADADAVAHELFAVLRDFDAVGVSAIWVEQPPTDPAWDGVRDRLQRAAA